MGDASNFGDTLMIKVTFKNLAPSSGTRRDKGGTMKFGTNVGQDIQAGHRRRTPPLRGGPALSRCRVPVLASYCRGAQENLKDGIS